MPHAPCPMPLVVFICSALSAGLLFTQTIEVRAQASGTSCSSSALERFGRHKVAPGETLESIAQRYNLDPATIIAMNSALQNGKVAVGSELQIPPYDGIVVEVRRGQTWRQVATKYKIRPDVLFEANGCQKNPTLVFVPLRKGSPNRLFTESSTPTPTPSKLAGYPLAEVAKVALPYGWQINQKTGEVFFHSGVNLLAAKGTPVQAISEGTIAFAGDKGSYGKLVIINHNGGLQSRYSQLENIKVSVGQQVKKGDLVGSVGTTGTPTLSQPYLHFEVRSSSSQGWVAQDPKSYLQR